MKTELIKSYIDSYKKRGLRMFTTSSFQTHSIPLLHIISTIDKTIPVYFINTGYHFPETVTYKDQIAELLGLNIVSVSASTPRSLQKDADGKLLFASDPDYCCHLNKVVPMEPVLAEFDVWINGVRADQSKVREGFGIEEQAPHNTLRFHPMLDWDMKTIMKYIKEHNLPKHPLEDSGYMSIGCEPCTRKFDLESYTREGRWFGLNKTECGLNTELIKK